MSPLCKEKIPGNARFRSFFRPVPLFAGHGLRHSHGEIGLPQQLRVRRALPELGREDLCVPFTAEQDDPLVEHAQALHRHRDGAAQIRLQRHTVEKPQIHSVESPVEAHRLHIHIDVQQPGSAALYGQSAVHHVDALELRIKAQVLKAILIPARIIDLFRVDANCLTNAVRTLYGTGHNSLGHCNTSY